MLKKSLKTALICSILVAQCPSINAGDYSFDFGPALVGSALVGVAASGVTILTLMKSYKWACKDHGPKKYIGRGVLGMTGIGALVGLGYAAGYMNKR